jgi:dTDP-4-amino-4,6-dideoxygalactose transaminase
MSAPGGFTVPFLNLQAAYLALKAELDQAVLASLGSGWYILGEEVERFEAEFAAYVGARHCIGVGNGLDALTLSLAAAGIGPGDEVIVPSNTFIATWLAVSHVGATPVPVEPDLRTAVITADAARAAITPRTKCLIPVHLYGFPCALPAFKALASQHGLFLLDDAAQAHGAARDGVRVGGSGQTDASAWSFYPGKNLGAFGDGGAITTDDAELAQKLRRLRNYGSSDKYVHEVLGWNSRLDPVQAAILRVKLRHLDTWNTRRKVIARRYLDELAGQAGLTLPGTVPNLEHVFHMFVVRSPERDALREKLSALGIQTLIHYPIPPHRQAAYAAADFSRFDLRLTEQLHREVLSLPIGPHMGDGDVSHVVRALAQTTALPRTQPRAAGTRPGRS